MSADSFDQNSTSKGHSSFFANDFDPSASPFDAQTTPAHGFPSLSSNDVGRSKGAKDGGAQGNSVLGKDSNPAGSAKNNSWDNSRSAKAQAKANTNNGGGQGGKKKKKPKTNNASNPKFDPNVKGSPNTMKDAANNYDFLWEDDKQRRSAKGDAGTTTVVESDTDYLLLPHPDIFNSYPPEVQRKIMEWADRDVRARRDDESLRQDALVRARAARERTAVTVPVAIIILCIVCAAVTGIVTRSALFVIAFLAIALAIILSVYFTKKNDLFAYSEEYEEEDQTEEE